MPIHLPSPLPAYFDSSNAHDAGALTSLFSPRARVRDEGQELIGQAAIHAWAEATFRKYDLAMMPESIEHLDGKMVVTAAVSGTFPGSPVRLGFRFETAEGKIDALEIG